MVDRVILSPLAINEDRYKSCPPAAPNAIANLPSRTITKAHLPVECPVCKENFEEEEVVLEMPCGHLFHPDCLVPWLKIHATCPLCRVELPTMNRKYERFKRRKERREKKKEESEGVVSPPVD